MLRAAGRTTETTSLTSAKAFRHCPHERSASRDSPLATSPPAAPSTPRRQRLNRSTASHAPPFHRSVSSQLSPATRCRDSPHPACSPRSTCHQPPATPQLAPRPDAVYTSCVRLATLPHARRPVLPPPLPRLPPEAPSGASAHYGSLVSIRILRPRPLEEGWSLPRTQSGCEDLPVEWRPGSSVALRRDQRAQNHLALPSAIPASARPHPLRRGAENLPEKHPAPPQEFFGKNSSCARGHPSRPHPPTVRLLFGYNARP